MLRCPLMPRHFSMLRDFQLPDLFTLGNGACGAAAIFCAIEYVREAAPGKLHTAFALLLAALVCDVLDGRVARARHQASALGRELDSLADVVSFGVAPACIAYALGLSGLWDALLLMFFVACGISRLARYNVTAEALAAATGRVTYFEGTPIPSSLLLVLFLDLLLRAGRVGAAFPGGVVSLLGYDLHPLTLLFALSGSLMVSKTLHIPKP
jgi:CDP-diacylglycerol--serine O-phosphatidyltransferase